MMTPLLSNSLNLITPGDAENAAATIYRMGDRLQRMFAAR
jgi:hypothetical protein